MEISKEENDPLLIGLSNELQQPYWDTLTVGKDLKTIFETVYFKAQKIHEIHPELSFEEAKIHAAAEIFESQSQLLHHPAVAEFLVENKEYGILKHLSPRAFNQQLKICLGRVEAMCNHGGDDHLYSSLIEAVSLMFKVMDSAEQATFQESLDLLLTSSKLSFTLFLSLVPFASQQAQRQSLGVAVIKWKHNFLSGLRSGNLSVVHDALFWLAHRRFLALIKEDFPAWKEISPYLEDLLAIHSIPSLNQSMEGIVRKNFKLRMENLTQEPITSSHRFYPLLKSIFEEEELGFALRKLYLLEQLLQTPKSLSLFSEMELILAMERQDLERIKSLLEEGSIALWKPLATGDTLIEIATQTAMLAQKEMQEMLEESCQKGEALENDFYMAFHKLVNAFIEAKRPKSKWTQVLEVITQAACRSNGVFIGKKSSLFFGKWEAPESLYTSILKVYLPADEHCLWKKYCINPANSQLGALMLDAYQGGAETYGLWFHLMQKVLVEKLQEKKGVQDWQAVYRLLGDQRRSVGLFLNAIQGLREGRVTLAARIQQEEIDKIWPGSPLNFGVPDSEFNVSHTTMLNEIRAHYLEKTAALIHKFNHYYSAELQALQSGKEHFKKVGKFEFNGREFLVYPNGEELSYAIMMPFEINEQWVSGVHILWGWPASSPFFCACHLPKRTPAVSLKFTPIWVHPSGEDKQKMFEELERLFSLLIQPIQNEEAFEQNLALFFYLFSQSVSYKRGSASIGLVLLSAILRLHGRSVPDAPPPPFFLDCEAMCATPDEFTAGFIIWLLTGVFEGSA